MNENIDYESLRKDLIDYFGSAMPIYPVAVMDVVKVENATEEELVELAIQNGFDLSNYIQPVKHYNWYY